MITKRRTLTEIAERLKFADGGSIDWNALGFFELFMPDGVTPSELRPKEGTKSTSVATLGQVINHGHFFIKEGFDGATGPGVATDLGEIKICTVTGGTYTERDLVMWDGVIWQGLTRVQGKLYSFGVNVIMASNALVGGAGATTFEFGKAYTWDSTASLFKLDIAFNDEGVVYTKSLSFAYNQNRLNVPIFAANIGDVIQEVVVVIYTAYNITPPSTFEVKDPDNVELAGMSDVDFMEAGSYQSEHLRKLITSGNVLLNVINDASTIGSGEVFVKYYKV